MRLSRRAPVESATREDQILSAALDLFFARGYRACSLRDLAAELGVNAATIYHYFESKDQILFRLQHDSMERLIARAVGALAETAGKPAADRMRALATAHFSYHTEHYKNARLHNAEWRALAPESREIIRERMKRYERLFTELVAEGAASGEFSPTATKVTAFTILGAGAHIASWYRPGGEIPDATIVKEAVELVMSGLLPRPAPP